MTPQSAILFALALPLVAAVLIAVYGRYPNLREAMTLVASGLLLLTTASLAPVVLAGERPAVELLELLPNLSITFTVEPLGMLFALVASLLWPINSLYSIGYMRGNFEAHQTRFYIYFAVSLSATMGVAFAGNLLTLFICYEVLSLATYPLVTHKGTPDAIRAGRVYLGLLLSTSIVLFLFAILWTWWRVGTLDFTPGGILAGEVAGWELGVLLVLYMYGIGKAALMPFHRWLPAAMVAPTPVSALLHAVAVVKAGVFSVVKVIVYVFGLEWLSGAGVAGWLPWVAGFTILAASVVALCADNLKRRLAYSTVSQLSYVILAAALLTPLSVMGAALHIAAHAFGKITLFFAAGSIYTAAHKTEVSQLDGIGRRMPWTMGAFTLGALSMIGVPPAAGFISKWYLLGGAFQVGHWPAVGVIVLSTVLNAAYFLPIVYAAFFRPSPSEQDHPHGEAPLPMVIALTLTASLTVTLFLFPDLPLALAGQLLEVV
ncbi:MAG: monovalent cation/H+ antiporter subunit D family protein [Candidatus Competibacteraceae bacterium]|nr:monovalent cation/H+ antiporter subunit D family protein [Candidatus Competibacteraceae bacterium]